MRPPSTGQCLYSFGWLHLCLSRLWASNGQEVTTLQGFRTDSPLCSRPKEQPSNKASFRSNLEMKFITLSFPQPMQYLGHSKETLPPNEITFSASATKLSNICIDFCLLRCNRLTYLSPYFAIDIRCQVLQTVQGKDPNN